MKTADTTHFLQFAKSVTKQAAAIMRQYSRADQQVEMKGGTSPVTVADKAINELLINEVKEHFPDHGVLGEEAVWHPERDCVWVSDPIDGTVQFILHIPVSMFSLALVVDGVVQVAVAYNPWTDDLYSAQKGGGAWRNETKITVSKRGWGKGLRLAGSSRTRGSQEPVDIPAIHDKLRGKGMYVTSIAGAVFKGCLIAEGSLDGRTFLYNGAHDMAALKLLIEEAGGKVTDLDGNEQRYDQPINGAILSNGLIHNDLLRLVKESTEYANHRD